MFKNIMLTSCDGIKRVIYTFTKLQNQNSSTDYYYDARGNVNMEVQNIDKTDYVIGNTT